MIRFGVGLFIAPPIPRMVRKLLVTVLLLHALGMGADALLLVAVPPP